MKDNNHYIYSHSDKEGVVRYIGEGHRTKKFYGRAHYFKHRDEQWYSIFPTNKDVKINIIEDNLTDNEASLKEKYWIDFYKMIKDGGTLVNKTSRTSFMTRAESTKYYRNLNPQLSKNRNKRWRDKNQDKIKVYCKKYRDENPDKIKERVKRSMSKNPSKYKAISQKYHEEHKEHIKIIAKKYREKNKNKIIVYRRSYSKEKKNASNKRWREKNKDYMIQYMVDKKDKRKEYSRRYREKQKLLKNG